MKPGFDWLASLRRNRRQAVIAVFGLTAVAWFVQFPLNVGDFEVFDITFAGLSLAFASGSAFLIFELDLPVLELGWAVFTYSHYIRLLDALAEGPETLESLLPGSIQLVGLGIILLGFVQTMDRLRSRLAERSERLVVLNRVLRHNMRNNLTGIISSFQYLEEKADDEQEQRMVEIGLTEAWSLSDLSEKLRRIDAILESANEEATETHDLGTVVASRVDEFREEYPDVEFDLSTGPDTRVATIEGVEAAVANVIENACEHNDAAQPAVSVAVESEDADTVTVTVHDNGSGIPANELEPIREGGESALSHSSGIGLWFVLWIVERSDGDIAFEYDDGQTVELRFPKPRTGGLLGRIRGR